MPDGSTPTQLISMPEIAELAGVERPVVSTWRRRHPDFPRPADGSGSRPLFDIGRVVEWLVDTGRADRRQIEPDLRLHQLTGLAGALPPADLVAAIAALICLRHLDQEPLTSSTSPRGLRRRALLADPLDVLVAAEVDGLPDGLAWLAAAVEELVEAAWGCQPAYERVLARRYRLQVPALYADAVTPSLSHLVAGLSGAREHADQHGAVHIAATAAGVGDLLVSVLDLLGEDATPTVTAAEADPFLARFLRRRLTLCGIPDRDLCVDEATTLPEYASAPDIVILQLPYRPMEDRGDADPLDAVRLAAGRLGPGQTAVVLGPADLLVGALPPSRAALRTRNALLTGGQVEAVIRLPGGVMPFRPAYQVAMWVLRHEQTATAQGRVLLADVSDRALSNEVADTLVWDVTTWRRHGHRPDQHLRAYTSQVAIADLVVPGRPLTARSALSLQEAAGGGHVTIARVADLEAELDTLGQASRGLKSALAAGDSVGPAPTRSIEDLVGDGDLIRLPGHRIAVADIAAEGHHRVLGAPELTGALPIASRTVDRGVLATVYPRARLTEPGDVVITLTPQFGVHLDHDGFSVVEFPARALRVTPDGRRRFTPRVLAWLLTTTAPGRPAGAVRPASRLDQVQVPLPPPGEIGRIDALLAVADERAGTARREIDLLDELCRIAVKGITDGTLTITDTPLGG